MKRFIAQWTDIWGEFRLRSPAGTTAFRVPFYEDTPLVSPRFAFSIAAAARLEKAIRRRGPGGLYLNCVMPLERSRRPIDRRMRRLGYACAHDCRIQEFHEPRPLKLPRGYSASLGPLLDPHLFRNYKAVNARCFPNGARFARTNRELTKRMRRPSWLAVVHGPDGRPAAAGGVTVGRETALLFGGSVLPGHRRRGLWKALLALRQGVARARGVELCILQTSNVRLMGAGDRTRRFLTYRKRAV